MTAVFAPLAWGHYVTEFAGVLVAGAAGDEDFAEEGPQDLLAWGSAFIIAPYLALTARHVIDEISNHFHGCAVPEVVDHFNFGIHLAVRHPDYGLMKWDVMGYGYSPSIDIVALILEPSVPLPEGFSLQTPTLSVKPPSAGDDVWAFGYPGSKHVLNEDLESKIVIDPHGSKGQILDVHERYRDRVVLPFPCACTDARFDGGMSGGPVFDIEGRVLGVVASGYTTEGENADQTSYFSLIWPALGLSLDQMLSVIPAVRVAPYPLKDLVSKGMISALGAELITIGETQVSLAYVPGSRKSDPGELDD